MNEIHPKTINIKGRLLELSSPLVMGILNVTPDSFYERSRKENENDVIERAGQIIAEGGTVIDIGGQSSNPRSPLMTADEELARLRPALAAINREYPDVILSVDTFYSRVAQVCVEEYGVAIINDISGGEMDSNMFAEVARLNVPYVLMHMKGTPQTMTQMTNYRNLQQEVYYYFSEKIVHLRELGVNDVIIDPGYGFSKTIEQNYELLASLRGFKVFGLPILIGVSRKRMIYNLLGINPDESLNGTTVLNTFALLNGADILRVHDVKATVEAIRIVGMLNKYKF